jgi:cold shock CspA family protein
MFFLLKIIYFRYIKNGNMLPQQLDGRITYQRSGETFYIPYSFSDVVSTTNAQLRIGDRVKFYIAHLLNNQMPVVSTYYARKVELISSQDSFMSISELAQHLIAQQQQQQPKQVYRGIITTLKDSFGKIEREDLFKETFFHFSEYRGQNANQELRLGLNVEFELQDRHGKEIACNIRMLKDGTVSFDELSGTVYIGRITEPLTKINSGINLNGLSMAGLSSVGTIHSIGRLIYDTNISCNSVNNGESLINLSFTDRDRVSGSGDYTLLEGDFVQFRIASDKRRKTAPMNSNINVYQRATQLTLIEEHSLVENSINTHEHRERGVLVKLYTAKDLLPASSHHHSQLDAKFGAIQCLEQNELVYFSFNEVINYVRFTNNNLGTTYSINEIQLQVGDSLEFSVVKCQKDLVFKNGLKAIRLRQLAKNSVQFEIISTETYSGLVEREAFHSSSSSPFNDNSTGLIRFDFKNGQTSGKNSSSQTIGYSYSEDQVFNTGDKVKFNMSTCLKTKKQTAVNVKLFEAFKEQGIITLVKDQLGFIEIIGAQQKNSKQQKILREIVFNSG